MTLRYEYDQVLEILQKYPEAYAKILDELYEYFLEDMPYGTQKARDGDPVEWITMRLDDLGLLTSADGQDSDEELEDEGILS